MIKSMTGFGRCEIAEADRKFTVEMKGVNHRYLDVNIRMPKKLNFFESAIRNLLKQYVQRGKIDIFIGYEDMTESQMTLKYNQKLAEEYMASFKQMEEQFGLDNDVRRYFRISPLRLWKAAAVGDAADRERRKRSSSVYATGGKGNRSDQQAESV